jgi:hypothetical protein
MENDTTIAMQFMLKLNEYQQEIIKSMNYIRGDIHELKCELKEEIDDLRQELRDYKEENNKRWDENDKRWERNEKRWDENDKRWDENERRWEENNKRWEKYEANRKEDKKFLIDTLINYDISISAQLCDSNAEKMRKLV